MGKIFNTHIARLNNITVEYVQHCGSDSLIKSAAETEHPTNKVKNSSGIDIPAKTIIKSLIEHRHLTPFEMCDITFIINCPMFVARQFFRHRSFSINEQSDRYSTVNDYFYIPEYVKGKEGSGSLTEEQIKDLSNILELQGYRSREYQKLLEQKNVAKTFGRLILAQNTMTRFYAKNNLRSWIEYCNVRLNKHVQFEHKYLCKMIFNELLKMFPIATGALALCTFSKDNLIEVGLDGKHC